MINKYTNKQRGLLAVIMAMVMVFAGAAFVAAEVDATDNYDEIEYTKEYSVTGDGFTEELAKITESLAEGEKAGKYLFNVTGSVTWETGASGGSTPFLSSEIIDKDTLIVIKGIDDNSKFVATGKGVGAVGIDAGTVVFKDIIIDDESVAYNEQAWEFTYLEFRGNTEFYNVVFDDGIMVEGNSSKFVLCTFTGKNNDTSDESDVDMFGIWVTAHDTDKNIVTIDNCTFKGIKGLKVHNKYTDGNYVVAVDRCVFETTHQTGIELGNVNTGDSLTVKNSIFVDCNPGFSDELQDAKYDALKVVVPYVCCKAYNPTHDGTIIFENLTTGSDEVELDDLESAEIAFETGASSVTVNNVVIEDGCTIPEGGELILGEGSTIAENATIIIPAESKLTASSAPEVFTAIVDDNEITLTGLKGSFTISKGSVMVNGNGMSGSVTVDAGTATITGSVEGVFEIIAGGGSNVIFKNLTINNGSSLILGDGLTYTVEDNMYLYGALVANDDVSIIVQDDSTFKAFGGATIPETVTVTGTEKAKIDLADAMSTMTINDDVASSNTYSQMQTVVIADTLTLKNTTVTTILGKFVVNEGVTLTIEEGAKLVINSTTADMIVDGTIIVEEGGDLIVENAKSVSVAGEIDSEGTVTIGSTVVVKENGKITIASGDDSSIIVTSGLTIEKGGELNVRSIMTINGITNKGIVTLNGATLNGSSVIKMASDGAIVDVKSIKCTGTQWLQVEDLGAILGKAIDGITDVVVTDDNVNRVAYQGKVNEGLSGLKITNQVRSETKDGNINYYNKFVLSGSIGIVDETGNDDDKSMILNVRGKGGLVVDDAVTVGKGVTFRLAAGELTVDGTIIATATNAKVIEDGDGKIDVNGLIQTITPITGTVNAAMYEADVNGTPNYYYTSFAKAIASGDDEITILGKITILEDVTVPAGVKVKASGAFVDVGDAKNRDVTVTFADGSEIRNGTIDVYGTVVFDNKKNMKGTIVNSDVAVIGDVSAMYTNLYTALANAKAGDVVTLTRNNVTIDSDLTIPADVTLDVPSGKTLTVEDDVTVTVLGTLRTASAVLAETAFATEASETASAIVVDGTFMSMAAIDYSTYKIPGAYYNIVDTTGNYNYVTPVEAAQAVAQTVTNGAIGIYGENNVSDVSFTGTSTQPITITVYADAEVEFDSIALEYASIAVNDGACVTGIVKSDSAEVSLTHVDYITITASVKDDATVTTVSGTPGKGDVDVDAKVTVSTGTVIIDSAVTLDALKSFTISNGAVVKVEKAGVLSAISLTVDGELIATNGGKVTVTTLTINGTLTVAEADTTAGITAGSASVTTMYVGVTAKALTGAGATVTGDVKFDNSAGIMYVLEGSTIPADLVKDRPSITYYVEDEPWITVYSFGATVATVKDIPIEDVFLEGWVDDKGKSAMDKDWKVTFSDEKKVYADIEYKVYNVTVTAVAGIDAVYMDGILMSGVSTTVNGNTFTATVAAGVHKITYTLANGYSGEATMIVNDEKVTGTEFTAGGTFSSEDNTVEYSIILQGIVKAPAETAPVVEDEGMDLTDILLIVLVVLIVIMAIIVALRMMRS